MADTASRADQVAALVASLKAGEITKAEMFKRLSEISSSVAEAPPAPAVGAASTREADDQPSTIATTDRRAMIQALLEQKRIERGGAPAVRDVPPTPEPVAAVLQAAAPAPVASLPPSGYTTPATGSPAGKTPAAFPPPPPPPANVDPAAYYAAYAAAIAQATGGAAPPPAGVTAAPPAVPTEQGGEGGPSPPTEHAPSPAAPPSRRRRGSGASDIDAAAALDALPFEERQRQWAAHKESQRSRREAEAAQRELEECTFAPKTSGRTLTQLAGGAAPGTSRPPIHERLFSAETPATQAKRRSPRRSRRTSYDASTPAEGKTARGGRAEWVGVASGGQGKPPRVSAAARSAGGHKGMVPSEEREMEECTFQPAVNPNRGRFSATPVRSRYLEHLGKAGEGGGGSRPTSARRRRKPPIPSGLEECTFTPKINPVRRKGGAAAEYVAGGSVFNRLASGTRAASASRSRPSSAARPPRASSTHRSRRDSSVPSSRAASPAPPSGGVVGTGGPPVLDMDSFLAAMDGEAPGGQQGAGLDDSGISRGSGRSTSSSRGARGTVMTKAEYEARFTGFLARQNAANRVKERRLAQVAASVAPSHRPRLCAKSMELVDKTAAGTFLDRVSRSAVRQEQSALQQRAAVAMDPECTFVPRINPSSRKRPARTATEMSVGDALRKETSVRMMRLRAEQENLAGVTFKPAINPVSAASQGRLRIQADPENYVARVQEAASLAEHRALLAKVEASQSELAGCTFAPEVHEAPTFVKRIARSMALTKAVRPPPAEESKKPDWR